MLYVHSRGDIEEVEEEEEEEAVGSGDSTESSIPDRVALHCTVAGEEETRRRNQDSVCIDGPGI